MFLFEIINVTCLYGENYVMIFNHINPQCKKYVIDNNTSSKNYSTVPLGYNVFSPQCKILSLDPLASDVMRLFSKEDFEACSKKHPLTSVELNYEEDTAKLIYHRGLRSKYVSGNQNQLDCCYQDITRGGGTNATADDKYM